MGIIGDIVKRVGNSEWGLGLSLAQREQLERYAEILVDWNATRMNLTRIVEPSEIAMKHFVDSLSVLTVVDVPFGARIIDVGTGAGMPGIPLKIARPDIKVMLLDSTAKKLTFCKAVIDDLKLEGIEAVHGRAEDISRLPDHRHSYFAATARAVASLDKLLPWCVPFVAPGGVIVALKGPAVVDEYEAAAPIAKRFRIRLEAPRGINLAGEEDMSERRIVIGRVG